MKICPCYPIHIKQITIADKGQYFVTIHRDYNSKQVIFNDLSYPFVEMLVQINEDETTIKDLKTIFSKYENDNHIIESTINDFIAFALQNNLLLGYK